MNRMPLGQAFFDVTIVTRESIAVQKPQIPPSEAPPQTFLALWKSISW